MNTNIFTNFNIDPNALVAVREMLMVPETILFLLIPLGITYLLEVFCKGKGKIIFLLSLILTFGGLVGMVWQNETKTISATLLSSKPTIEGLKTAEIKQDLLTVKALMDDKNENTTFTKREKVILKTLYILAYKDNKLKVYEYKRIKKALDVIEKKKAS